MVNKIIEFHAILEKEATELEYGQITVNVYLKSSVPVLDTLNIIKQKRFKFRVTPKESTP